MTPVPTLSALYEYLQWLLYVWDSLLRHVYCLRGFLRPENCQTYHRWPANRKIALNETNLIRNACWPWNDAVFCSLLHKKVYTLFVVISRQIFSWYFFFFFFLAIHTNHYLLVSDLSFHSEWHLFNNESQKNKRYFFINEKLCVKIPQCVLFFLSPCPAPRPWSWCRSLLDCSWLGMETQHCTHKVTLW